MGWGFWNTGLGACVSIAVGGVGVYVGVGDKVYVGLKAIFIYEGPAVGAITDMDAIWAFIYSFFFR